MMSILYDSSIMILFNMPAIFLLREQAKTQNSLNRLLRANNQLSSADFAFPQAIQCVWDST